MATDSAAVQGVAALAGMPQAHEVTKSRRRALLLSGSSAHGRAATFFAALADDLAHRPTNSSVAKIVENVVSPLLDEKLTPIVTEQLSSIRRDLEDLRAKVENVIEYGKEIDHALDRIAAIEKQLGVERKIAA